MRAAVVHQSRRESAGNEKWCAVQFFAFFVYIYATRAARVSLRKQ